MATNRPVDVAGGDTQPKDDGLFGPDSVTWRVLASPASAIGGGTAVLMQMLHPRVLRLLDQTASDRADPAERARLTEEYVVKITYRDTASAERAGEVLRRIHSHRKAVDPVTGETFTADTPELLLWVHATLVWGFLASSARWGPKLTKAECDRFVDEQRISARLVGIDPAVAPKSVAELDAYVARMLPQLAYVTETKAARETFVPPRLPFSAEGLVGLVVSRATVDLLSPAMQDLYGFRWPWLNHLAVRLGSAILVALARMNAPYEKLLPELRAQSAAHAFGSPAKRQRRARAKEAGIAMARNVGDPA